MKKAIFFFAFTLALGIFSAGAQSCSAAAGSNKSCCAGKMAKVAAADPSLEKRQNDDGSVSYVRKEADAQGSVKFVSVQFDAKANTFVNVAPAMLVTDKTEMTKKTASCAASEKKACCASGSASKGKSCCANKTAGACEKKAEQ